MAWLDDLVTLVEGASVATRAERRLLLGSKAKVPTNLLASGVLSIVEYAGAPPLHTHNSVSVPAYVRPSAQFLARATSYTTARSLAQNAYNAVCGVRNQFVNSGWYQSITPIQEPFDFGVDEEQDCARIVFNVTAVKRP